MKNKSKHAFHTRAGSYTFYLLAVFAAALFYSSQWAWEWIPGLYPLGDAFIPTLFCVIGVCALINLIFLAGADKFSQNGALRGIHTASCVLSGILCGYCLFLMLRLDNPSLDNMLDGLDELVPNLVYLIIAAALPLPFMAFSALKKK